MNFKPLSISLFTLVMILTLTSCYTTSAPFQITSEGYPIESEMNPMILEKSIHLSLLNYGWEVTSKNEGKITAKYSKRMTIHRNYSRWIANLNKIITENYNILETI